jgi:putative ABC transport system substrate-binding protein
VTWRRAAVLLLLVSFASAGPAAAATQRLGLLSLEAPGPSAERDALMESLRQQGFVAGRNLIVESRFAEGRRERLPELAAELIRLNVDVIVAERGQATRAAQAASATVPVVMVASSDPVGTGIVTELARPGGNVTGVTLASPEISGKRLELLKELVPRATRVAVVFNDGDPGKLRELGRLQQAARGLNLVLEPMALKEVGALAGTLAAIDRARPAALIVLADPVTIALRSALADFAAARRLAAMYELAAFVDAGGLIAYGPNIRDMYRRAGFIVDKILRGARPDEIPVEAPATFELIVNTGAARALGVTLPGSILLRATRVVE